LAEPQAAEPRPSEPILMRRLLKVLIAAHVLLIVVVVALSQALGTTQTLESEIGPG
jgi:hypothetical protein